MNIEQLILENAAEMTLAEFDEYLIEVQLNLMDAILEKKMDEGKIVFSEVEFGLLN